MEKRDQSRSLKVSIKGLTEVEARKKWPEGKVEPRRMCCGQIRKLERMV